MPRFPVVVVIAALLVASTGCLQASTGGSGSPTPDPLSESEIRDLARDRFSFDSISRVERIDSTNFSELYPQYRLWVVRGSTDSYPYPVRRVLAVRDRNTVYELPAEFDRLNNESDPAIDSVADFKTFVHAYVDVRDPEAIVLHSVDEIPRGKGADPETVADEVAPPEYNATEHGYTATVYTWHPGPGRVIEWTIELSDGAGLQVTSTEIASQVGDWEDAGYS